MEGKILFFSKAIMYCFNLYARLFQDALLYHLKLLIFINYLLNLFKLFFFYLYYLIVFLMKFLEIPKNF